MAVNGGLNLLIGLNVYYQGGHTGTRSVIGCSSTA